MEIPNPFKLQNWKFKKFLIAVLFFQISLLGLFVLNEFGVDTPIIRPIIGFIYLFFIPGYLLLKILRLHNLDSIESFLYALGLSLFTDMFVGFLMNMLYPILGITDKPITEIPIVLTMAGVVFLLCIIAYFKDKNYNNPDYIDLKDILNPQVLFLSLIPFMSIFGTYLVNYYDNNILLMIMIPIIPLILLMSIFTSKINKKYYSYLILLISITILLHNNLISQFIIINDNIGEYYIAKTTLQNGIWKFSSKYESIPTYNSILSTSILPPIIKLITKIPMIYIYKIIFPIITSLIPLYIYLIINYIFKNPKLSLAMSFLYISLPSYIRVSHITKQSISMFFVASLLYVIISKKFKKSIDILVIIFIWSIIFSHYGTTYLICAMFIYTTLLLRLFIYNNEILFYTYKKLKSYTIIILISTIAWYMYVSNSISFNTLVNLIHYSIISTYNEFLNPYTSRGLFILAKKLPSITSYIVKYIIILLNIIITIGLFGYIYKLKQNVYKISIVHYLFSTFWYILLVSTIVVSNLAAMDPQRLYLIAIIFLCPFIVFGLEYIYYIIFLLNRIFSLKLLQNITKLKFIIIIVSIISITLYFTTTTKYISELINDYPSSISISKESIFKAKNPKLIISYYLRVTTNSQVYCGKWLSKYSNKEYNIYVPYWIQLYPSLCIYGRIPLDNVNELILTKLNDKTGKPILIYNTLKSGSTYIQLIYPNILYNIGWGYYNDLHMIISYNISKIDNIIRKSSKIYDNGYTNIYIY